jgi:pSer/pThr/pTyr-binding forkhead associated (FHA) protein
MAILTLVFGREVLGTYDIEKDKMIIGRGEDSDIEISNLAVSRHHAIIEKNEGVFTVNDLDSNNGTFVNGQRINRPTTLNFGDEIGIGKHVLAFDSHSKKGKVLQASSPHGDSQPALDSPAMGTMFVEPEKMEKIREKATAARKAHLKPIGPSDAKLIPLDKTDTVFGKSSDSDVIIKGFFASPRHAILSRLENGFHLTNLAVISPTKVNGIRIDSALIVDDDEVIMGKSKFIFHSEQ